MQPTRRGAARLAPLAVFSSLAFSVFALTGCHHSGTDANSGGGTPGASALPDGAAATLTTPKGSTLTISQAAFFAQLQNYTPRSAGQAGQAVMQQMLAALMSEGLAQDQGAAPTDAEVNAAFDDFKLLQGFRLVKPFDQALADTGLTTDVFKETQIKPQLAQTKLLTKGVTVSDADVQAYYNSHKDKPVNPTDPSNPEIGFTNPARAHIKRIVVGGQAEAQAISKAIAGGQTFESQVAQSLDKSSPDGDFPAWVQTDPIPAGQGAQIKVIAATPAGSVTPPIAFPGSQPGAPPTYWLVKVVEKKPKEVVPFDQVKDLIREQILQQKVRAALADPAASEGFRQQLHDFQAASKLSIAGPQYAALAQQLTHPAPLPPPAPAAPGGSPFAPAPGKP